MADGGESFNDGISKDQWRRYTVVGMGSWTAYYLTSWSWLGLLSLRNWHQKLQQSQFLAVKLFFSTPKELVLCVWASDSGCHQGGIYGYTREKFFFQVSQNWQRVCGTSCSKSGESFTYSSWLSIILVMDGIMPPWLEKNMMSSKSLLVDKWSVLFHAPSPVLSKRDAL